MTPRSSHIAAIQHDSATGTLRIRFKNGAEYEYRGVDGETAQKLQDAKSWGVHFHRFVKPHFRAKRV